MQAVVMDRYGELDVLEKREVADPRPGPGEVLVEVFACGLNPVDYKIRHGALKDLFAVNFPHILGGDISGVVRELGVGASDFKVGDEVFFSNPLDRDGGNAQYVVVQQTFLAKKPRTISHVEAASLPVVALTSLQALRDFGKMKPGSRVLIHAGAGGVGSFAIQYAKSAGAIIYTTASRQKADYVRALGAERVIDYHEEDFVDICTRDGGMDIVLETLGGESYAKSILATREGGAVPCIVAPPDEATRALAERRRVKTEFLLLHGNRPDLDEIARLIDGGVVRTSVSRVLSLDEVCLGHELLESGRTQGKLVVQIRD